MKNEIVNKKIETNAIPKMLALCFVIVRVANEFKNENAFMKAFEKDK